jgi:hypothetical protein
MCALLDGGFVSPRLYDLNIIPIAWIQNPMSLVHLKTKLCGAANINAVQSVLIKSVQIVCRATGLID